MLTTSTLPQDEASPAHAAHMQIPTKRASESSASSRREPELVIADDDIETVLKRHDGREALIVTDTFNASRVSGFANVHVITSAEYDASRIVRAAAPASISTVIGVGGCSALDVARYVATPDRTLVLVPSILSTSCISVNRSVLYRNGLHQSVKTITPTSVVVPLPHVRAGEPETLWNWSQSGFGDVFANFSASLDIRWRLEVAPAVHADAVAVWDRVPSAKNAVEWVVSNFADFDTNTLAQLATFIHASSMEVLHADSVELSASGEHDLYYNLLCDHGYPHHRPTHGQIVAVGTYLAARAYERLYGDRHLAAPLHEAFRLLRLPTSYAEMARAGLSRDHLLQGLSSIRARTTFLAWAFRTWGVEFVDSAFDARH